MEGTGRTVMIDSSLSDTHTIEKRSWGCAPSTSYSTSNVGLQHTPSRLPQSTTVQSLSFSLQSDRQSYLTAAARRLPSAATQRQSPHQNLSSLLGSISLSLPHAKLHKHKRKQAASQGTSFKVSDLHPSRTGSTALRGPSSNTSSTANISFTLDSFELSDDRPTHTQRPLFASMSSACAGQMRKRKAPSIATDTSCTSAVSQPDRPAAVQHVPLMQLAQGQVKAISRIAEEGESESANLAAAGSKLRHSAMVLPRNIRRLLAGAFAGKVVPPLDVCFS